MRPVELARRAHQDMRAELLTGHGPHAPNALPFFKRCAGNLGSKANVLDQAVLDGTVVEIVLNFRLPREPAAPARVRLEGKAIEVRGNVAARAGIAVVVPGTAQAVGFLEDGEGRNAGLLEPDPHAQPRHAGAEDGNRGRVVRGRSLAAWACTADRFAEHPVESTGAAPTMLASARIEGGMRSVPAEVMAGGRTETRPRADDPHGPGVRHRAPLAPSRPPVLHGDHRRNRTKEATGPCRSPDRIYRRRCPRVSRSWPSSRLISE